MPLASRRQGIKPEIVQYVPHIARYKKAEGKRENALLFPLNTGFCAGDVDPSFGVGWPLECNVHHNMLDCYGHPLRGDQPLIGSTYKLSPSLGHSYGARRDACEYGVDEL